MEGIETMKVTLYTDGSARGNPDGPGGYGAVLQFVDKQGVLHEKEMSAGYVKTTNNRMELMAAIVGLEALNRPCQVELYSDSKYLVDAFNQHWIESWVKNNWNTPTIKIHTITIHITKRLFIIHLVLSTLTIS